MPRISFPEIAADLTDFLSPAAAESLQPTAFASEIIPTFPVAGKHERIRAYTVAEVLGAVGATDVTLRTVPADRKMLLVFCSLRHNEGAARGGRVAIVDAAGIQVDIFSGTIAASGAAGENAISLQKPVVVGPGLAVRGFVDTLGAAFRLRVNGYFVDLRFAEPVPPI